MEALMHIDATDLIYGAVTLAVFLWSFARGNIGVKIIGAVTMGGWFFFQVASYISHYSLEQVLFAIGDAIQAAIILSVAYRCKMSRLAFWGFAGAFLAMLGLHLAVLITKPTDFYLYHLALNRAYDLQLLTIGGVMLGHEYLAFSHRLSDRPYRLRHSHRGSH